MLLTLLHFVSGNTLLVLLPIPGHPLRDKFHDPYVVEQHLGPVDYVIATPDRRKTKRLCHVNLLKKYHECDPKFVTCITTEPASVRFRMSVRLTQRSMIACRLCPQRNRLN